MPIPLWVKILTFPGGFRPFGVPDIPEISCETSLYQHRFPPTANLAWMLNCIVVNSDAWILHRVTNCRHALCGPGYLPGPGARLLLLLPGSDPPRRHHQLIWKMNRHEFEVRSGSDMVCVLEYGDNIGTLRNLFRDEAQAIFFAKHIMDLSEEEYTCIATNKWYCSRKNEYIEIQEL